MLISVCILLSETFTPSVTSDMRKFQTALGGLGLGSVRVPAWNFRDFDPRLQPIPEDRLYPVPGGYAYSPERMTSITAFPEIPPLR